MPYQAAIEGWHDFYLVSGGASATLVGLLFVGLSLHLRAVISRPEVRTLARVTLTNLCLVLLVALFILIPQDRSGFGFDLIISGIISGGIVTPSLVGAARSRTRTLRVPQLVTRFGLSAVGYAGVVAAGALINAGSIAAGLVWICAVSIALLVISLRNSWDLLVSVGEATMEEKQAGR